MKVLCLAALSAAAVAMAAGVTPARAQMGGDGPHINMLADAPSKTPDEIEQEKVRDKAYKDTLKSIPDAKASSDPWGGVRGSDAPKTATAKTATAKTAKAATARTAPAKSAAKAKPKAGGNTPN